MNLSSLSPTSYAILGMVATYGPATSYQVKKLIDQSVGYFWTFPRAQLYVELDRFEENGLLLSTQEESGRRRRRYSITDAGRDALKNWIRSDDSDPPQYRDPGLLKLFFAGNVSREDVQRLAQVQIEVHNRLLAEYRAIQVRLVGQPAWSYALATVQSGIVTSESGLAFWNSIINNPPDHSAFDGALPLNIEIED